MAKKERVEVDEKRGSVYLRLRNVRLSFPALFKPRAFDETTTAKFSAAFLLPADGDPNSNLKLARRAVSEVLRMNNKGKKLAPNKYCLKDGTEKAEADIDGYEGMWYLSSSNTRQPLVVDQYGSAVTEQSGKVYAGCYVNATVRLWWQDNKFGKRVNAQVQALQFARDGDPFGDASVDPDEEFEYEDADADADDADDGDEDEAPRNRKATKTKKPTRRSRPADEDDEDDLM